MKYRVELSQKSSKFLEKLELKDKESYDSLVEHLENLEQNPEHFGKRLIGNLIGLWSYRVGKFRILYMIQKQYKMVFIVIIGYRRDVYE